MDYTQILNFLGTFLPAGLVTVIGLVLTTFLPVLLKKLVNKSCDHSTKELEKAIEAVNTQNEQISDLYNIVKEISNENLELKKQNVELKEIITKIKEE